MSGKRGMQWMMRESRFIERKKMGKLKGIYAGKRLKVSGLEGSLDLEIARIREKGVLRKSGLLQSRSRRRCSSFV